MKKQFPAGHKKLVDDFLKHYEENYVFDSEKPLNYRQMQMMGMLLPFAVRLPITTIGVLDALAQQGPWASKQEMIYEFIAASIQELCDADERIRELVKMGAEKGLEDWKAASRAEKQLPRAKSQKAKK